MTHYFELIRGELAAVHPALPSLVLMLTVWLSLWGVRRWAPRAWAIVAKWGPEGSTASHLIQALPALVLGAAVAALGSGGDVIQAVSDAMVAAIAPLWHHLLKALPGPYRGAAVKLDGPTSRRQFVAQHIVSEDPWDE